MAVFGELNRQPQRLQDPEARKTEAIKRAAPAKSKKSRSSVSVKTYRRSILVVNLVIGLVVSGGVIYLASVALGSFMEQG